MGDFLDNPGWVAGAIVVVLMVFALFVTASRNTIRQIEATLAKRANPSRAEFLASMASDVSPEVGEFLWHTASQYLEFFSPKIAPHPDDHLLNDLPIDDEEWRLDWPEEWAEKQEFHSSNLHDWPAGWEPTIRNYGKWLDMGPAQ